nr:MAG TPA: Interferon-related protein conserved region [Caudoviricetes sp.]
MLKLHNEFLFTIFDFGPGMAYNNGAEMIRKR